MRIKQGKATQMIVATTFFVASSLLMILILIFDRNGKPSLISSMFQGSDMKCETLNLMPGVPQIRRLAEKSHCFTLEGSIGQELLLEADMQVSVMYPESAVRTFNGLSRIDLVNDTYKLRANPGQDSGTHQIIFTLSGQGENEVSFVPSTRAVSSAKNIPSTPSQASISYNVKTKPPFIYEQKLQSIVDRAIAFIESSGYSRNSVSISLVDLTNSPCCAYAAFQDQQPRFPASIPKLFWLVALYGQYNVGIIPDGTIPEKEVYKMIQNSDNQPASQVLDQITQTESGKSLPPNEFNQWMIQRASVNRFFQDAGYQNINISQKNFPIPYLKLTEPTGRDLQLRQIDGSQKPFRNFLTAYDVTRLLYEIDTKQAISQAYSQRIESHLRRDLRPEAWQHIQYNSIKGFLGEYLPTDTYFASKVGWTSDSRSDAAIISTPDGRTRYALVIFSEGANFAQDWEIFPKVSRFIYNQMVSNQR